MKTGLKCVLSLLLFSAAYSAGCHKNHETVETTAPPPTTTVRPTSETVVMALPADRLRDDDRRFFDDAASGGLFEVRCAQLLIERSTNRELQEFAQHMLADHRRINDQLRDLAARKGF